METSILPGTVRRLATALGAARPVARVVPALLVISALGRGVAGQAMDALLEGAPAIQMERCDEPGVLVLLEGYVLGPEGAPAEGAVVVSSAGGKAVTDAAGGYRLEVEVPLDAASVQVTAIGRTGENLAASTRVEVFPTRAGVLQPAIPVGPLELVRGSSCSPRWVPTFGDMPGTEWYVRALAVHDDGTGPALYVGGEFTGAGSAVGNYIARWDGSTWSDLGSGMAGSFPSVRALAVHDDGRGPALYAGGQFTTAGGVAANNIARWDGSTWAPLGSGTNNFVRALVEFDDGSGLALYAGGQFTTAGGVAASRIARWDGSTWAPLGSGLNGWVHALAVYDDGRGPALYAGGDFTMAGDVTAYMIARWDGSTWSAVGGGVSSYVWALSVYDDGSGPALYAGGYFGTAGGVPALGIARWDGSAWSALGSGMSAPVSALAVHDDGSGPALYAGGAFGVAGGVIVRGIARWDGSTWSALGSGVIGLVRTVYALATNKNTHGLGDTLGGGPALHAGGGFTSAGGVDANYVARWSGSTWSALGSGLNDSVLALRVSDDGTGSALYAAGNFTSTGSMAANGIARWNGSTWSALGNGISGSVHDLATYDDGRGPALYAAGWFSSAGTLPDANNIARWNGSSWSRLRSGLNSWAWALTVHDDGSGPALYVGGVFSAAGNVAANGIARWNGSTWSALGSGVDGDVYALALYDDGSGPALYAGGYFTEAGGVGANYMARWNGSSWSALGSGMDSWVLALAVYDDGNGPALYAGGHFTNAGGAVADHIARWDGSTWSPLGGGTRGGAVAALAVYDDTTGPALFAGGAFNVTFDSGDSFLAKWGCPDAAPPLLSCPAAIEVPDHLRDGVGEVVNFTVTATDTLDPSPTIVSMPPSGSTFPPGTTIVKCKATDASGNRSTCQFPVTVQLEVRRR